MVRIRNITPPARRRLQLVADVAEQLRPERALAVGTRSFRSVKSILDTKLDRKRPEKAAEGPAIVHDNIRGPTFYH